jgi:hypothetical protein
MYPAAVLSIALCCMAHACTQAAAVLLLRLLAWRRIASMMSPSPSLLGGAPEAEEPLRCASLSEGPAAMGTSRFRIHVLQR